MTAEQQAVQDVIDALNENKDALLNQRENIDERIAQVDADLNDAQTIFNSLPSA